MLLRGLSATACGQNDILIGELQTTAYTPSKPVSD